MSETIISYKILLLGDTQVGKTAFIRRFCDGKFEDESSISTIGLDTKTKFIMHQNKKIELKIWDTAGEERFRSITKNTFKGAHGILLMYDISDKVTFKHIKNWINDIKTNIHVGFDKIALIILGNKCDLSDDLRQVDQDDIDKFESENDDIKIMEVSAKIDKNINESMIALVEKMISLGIGTKKVNDYDYEDGRISITRNNNTKDTGKKGCCIGGDKKK